MLATHPDVIFTEALGSAGTYLGEVKTLNGGQMIPFIGTSATIDPQWFAQVSGAIGVDNLVKYYAGVDLGYTFSGPAYTEFITNLNAAASSHHLTIRSPGLDLDFPGCFFDTVPAGSFSVWAMDTNVGNGVPVRLRFELRTAANAPTAIGGPGAGDATTGLY